MTQNARVTLWNSVPALMEMLITHLHYSPSDVPHLLRLALLSGDWIPAKLIADISKTFPGTEVIGLGGATEASIWSNYFPASGLKPGMKHMLYGTPLANQRFHILNENMQASPDWVPGHLYIAGKGLANGYWRDKERTEAQFFHHPATGEMLYATDDLGRYFPDGNIEFLGRDDFQVKIGGHRIELGEIEETLNKHPCINKSIVTVSQHAGTQALVAFVVLDDSATISKEKLFIADNETNPHESLILLSEYFVSYLSELLPHYMVPAFYASLPHFPLSQNGKVDRGVLPVAALLAGQRDIRQEADAETPLEKKIAVLWKNTLGLSAVSRHDNYFSLGGDSISAIRIMGELRQELGQDIPLRLLFEHPTIAGFASLLTSYAPNIPEPYYPQIQPSPSSIGELFPLTPVQHAYWIGRKNIYALGNIATHYYFELDTPALDLERLQAVWRWLIEERPMMRAVISPDGQTQRIMSVSETPTFVLTVENLLSFPVEEQQAHLNTLREQMSHQVLPADSWPLFDFRVSIYQGLEGAMFRLHIDFDNIIFDAWSVIHILGELKRLCSQKELPPHSQREYSFRDYVLGLDIMKEGQAYQTSWNYWLQWLPELPNAPQLPLRVSPEEIDTPRFTRRVHKLSSDLWGNLQRLAAERDITPSSLLAAAYSEVLGK